MKADLIIKNARVFTADSVNPQATAFVVKDGKFLYVGDEAGLAAYEGEVIDLGGKFIMPGIIDSHVHVTTGIGFEYVDYGEYIDCSSKQEALDFMAQYVNATPGLERYRFILNRNNLRGEELIKEDLDAICPDHELQVLELDIHSLWVNSKILEAHGITDATPDPAPGLAYFVRKNGHITGNAFESAGWPFLFDYLKKRLTDEQIASAIARWIAFCKEYGVCSVFDAGFPENNDIHERIYSYLRELDRRGELPIYIDGCYVLTNRHKMMEAIEETKRFNREFDTEHLKVHTLKIFMDGTLKIETAAMVTPYVDTGTSGATTFNAQEVAVILKELNKAGLDLHVHTVGEQASRVVLDGVELARKELGDDFRVKVTCAHLWVQDDADLGRFAKLGVTADFSPAWHSGVLGGNPYEAWSKLLGPERAAAMFRSKTIWDTGALVTWSSDDVAYGDFSTWNPYLGIEIGMTRFNCAKTRGPEVAKVVAELPTPDQKMSIGEMLIGYTINGAKQLGIEATKGSIAAGKDADFLVFDRDLLTAEHAGFSHILPTDVFFAGKKVN